MKKFFLQLKTPLPARSVPGCWWILLVLGLGSGFASAGELYQISIAKEKPPCSDVSHSRCWGTQPEIWQHLMSAGEAVLLSNDPLDNKPVAPSPVFNPVVVRLPALYVPILLASESSSKQIYLQLVSIQEEKEFPVQLRFRLENTQQAVQGQLGEWLPFRWRRSVNTSDDRRITSTGVSGSTRRTPDPDEFYIKVGRYHEGSR